MSIKFNNSVDFELELEKPDGTKLGFINAYNVNINLKSKDLSELSFNLPEYVDSLKNGQYQRDKNPYYSLVRENFYVILHIRNKKNNNIIMKRKFKLSKSNDSTDGNKTTVNWTCYAGESTLNNKKIIDFAGVPIDSDGNTNTTLIDTEQVSVISGVNIDTSIKEVSILSDYIPVDLTLDGLRVYEVIQSLLSGTGSSWSLKYIDEELEGIFRSGITVSNTFLLEAINSICDIFQAIPIYDYDEKTINLFKLTSLGLRNGLSVEYGKYLKTLTRDKSAEKLITRVRANGADGIGINGVTTSGQNYIEDYTYFFGSFERDDTGEIITSSEWFSDGLSIALLDYFELVEEKEVIIRPLIEAIEERTSLVSMKEQEIAEFRSGRIITETQEMGILLEFNLSEEPTLKTDGDVSLGIGLVERINSDGSYIEGLENIYNYDTKNDLDNIENGEYTIGLITKTTVIDGENFSYTTVDLGSKKLHFSGSNPEVGDIIRVTYTTIGLTSINDLISSYTGYKEGLIENDDYIEEEVERITGVLHDLNEDRIRVEGEIEVLEGEIEVLEEEISVFRVQVNSIYDEISINNNFTQGQIEEWENYIIEGVYQNTNIDDQKLLLTSAQEYLEEKKFPETTIDTSIISVLQTENAEHDWNNIRLFDKVDILFERLDINVTSQIYEINIDVDNYSMSLVISTVRDYLNGTNDYIKTFFSKTARTSGSVDYNAPSWDNGADASDELEDIKEEGISTDDYRIFSSVGGSVRIDGDGISIQKRASVDKNGNPIAGDQGLIRMTNGLIELSEVGSEFKTAITPKRIVADVIQGKLLIGNELEILGGDENINDIIRGGIIPQANIIGSTRDDFGLIVSGYVDNNIVKAYMTRDNGFGIDVEGEKIFSVDSTGGLNVERIHVGSGDIAGFNIESNKMTSYDTGGYITSTFVQDDFVDDGGIALVDGDDNKYIALSRDRVSIKSSSPANNEIGIVMGIKGFTTRYEGYLDASSSGRWIYNSFADTGEIARVGSSTKFVKSNFKELDFGEVQDFIDGVHIQKFDKYKKKNARKSIGFIIEQLEEDNIPFAKEIVGYNEYSEVFINKKTGYPFNEKKDKEKDREIEKRRSYDYDAMFGAILAVNKLQNKQIKELQERLSKLEEKIGNT